MTMAKQYTIKIEGYITITAKDGLKAEDIPMNIDVHDFQDDDTSPVLEVNETEITSRSIETEAEL